MSNEIKQTAVEWLVNRWKKLQSKGEKMSWNQIIEITELVKEMEKEQIVNAFCQGDNTDCLSEQNIKEFAEHYYNETFKQQ